MFAGKNVLAAAFAHAIVILLFAGVLSASYEKQVIFSVTDSDGLPVQGAQFTGTYQQSNANSDSDGTFSIRSDGNGLAAANISNVVPKELEKDGLTWAVSAYGYEKNGNKELIDTDSASPLHIAVLAPISQQNISIEVVDFLGNGIPNATILVLEPYQAQSITGDGGLTSFLVPNGQNIQAFAQYGGFSVQGSWKGGNMTIEIPDYSTQLRVDVDDATGAPVVGAFVTATSESGVVANSTTGTDGIARIWNFSGKIAHISALAKKQLINQTIQIQSRIMDANITVPTLLSVDVVVAPNDDGTCAVVTAAATDPRTRFNNTVQGIFTYPDNSSQTFPMAQSNGGIWRGNFCPSQQGRVGVVAKNEYDTVEAYYPYAFIPAQVSAPAENNSQNTTVPDVPLEQKPLFNIADVSANAPYLMAIGGLALLLVAILYFRKEVGYYVYSVIKFLRKTKKQKGEDF